jgi:DNA-binding NarL/FixJ family response regulator
MAGLRVVLADDDALLREGLASLLGGAGYDVVGQAGDGARLLELVRSKSPDLVIVDIRMPPTNTTEGLEAARAIRAESPEVGILLLSAHVEVDIAMDLLNDGERVGYLLKSRVMRASELLDAIERVREGASVIDPALVQELFAARRRKDPLAELTPREREVLSNAGIAHSLWVTESAVEKHVSSILMKLKLPASEDDHRRVLAVVTYLKSR